MKENLFVDYYFATPVYMGEIPEWIDSLNKASDLFIKESKYRNKDLFKNRNKELGKKLKLNYFASNSYENLANLIKKISKNNNLLKKQVNFNRNIIKYYNWDNISKQYIKLFKKIKKRKIISPINNYSNA